MVCFSWLLLDLSPPCHIPSLLFFLCRFFLSYGFSLSFCSGRFSFFIIKGFWETHGVDFHHLFSLGPTKLPQLYPGAKLPR
ncbi:hypothetical protein B9Z19DRAFT_682948 [Tuber borchii]|uniref:Uncharacterized protein n=1 Tax=Tuber borchii TaxID=42251 RepID=A0A2T6ZZB7_TUBBO|nr:hypothetical protein B9Z19DRAFT_682948 [Tuber borchii]